MFSEPIDKKLDKKLSEYEEVFPEGFPLMQFTGTKKELIKEINKCIRNKEEYDTSFWDDPDVLS